MSGVRNPKQKRSIEKKQAIIDAGYDLFCEKGYRKTTTIEIAKRAGVSTGAVYNYFKDKRDIYIAAYGQYLEERSDKFLMRLRAGVQQPFRLTTFVEHWIHLYTEIYADTNHVLAQLRVMMLEDQEINNSFCNMETQYVSAIIKILNDSGVAGDALPERVYAACVLVDTLNREKSAFPHNNLSFEVLKKHVTDAVYQLLYTEGKL